MNERMPTRPSYVACCWTYNRGESQSALHIGDPGPAVTLCGIARKPRVRDQYTWCDWIPMGRPVPPGTLTTLGGSSVAITCEVCWREYAIRTECEERREQEWRRRQGKRELVVTAVEWSPDGPVGLCEGRRVRRGTWGWYWLDGDGYLCYTPGVWGVREETWEERREREQRERDAPRVGGADRLPGPGELRHRRPDR